MTINEGNKLIGEFMEVVVSDSYPNNKESIYYHYDFGTCTHKSDYKSPDGLRFHTELTVKYHSSWDWFIPVIIHISNQGYKIDLSAYKLHKEPMNSFQYPISEGKSIWAVAIQLIKHINTLREFEDSK